MTLVEPFEIVTDADKLTIKNLVIYDKEVVDYFRKIKTESRTAIFIASLKMIVGAINKAGLVNQFIEEEKALKEIFDPSKENSPLYKLQNSLRNEIMLLRNQIVEKNARDELAKKTPLKGQSFEIRCEKIISEVCRYYGDLLENTTLTQGKLTGCKKGDFVVQNSENNKKIVFEMKDVSTISFYQIQKTLKDSMENRDASYAILVVRSVESLPKSAGWFQEYEKDMLVCALSSLENQDDTLHPELLLIAYKWARLRIMQKSMEESKIDPKLIQEKITKIQNKISELRIIKTQCKNIGAATNSIRTIATQLEVDISRELSLILGSIVSK